MNWETGIDIYTLPCVNRPLVGIYCSAQGAQTVAEMTQMAEMGEQEGSLGERSKREEIYVYIQLMYTYS